MIAPPAGFVDCPVIDRHGPGTVLDPTAGYFTTRIATFVLQMQAGLFLEVSPASEWLAAGEASVAESPAASDRTAVRVDTGVLSPPCLWPVCGIE